MQLRRFLFTLVIVALLLPACERSERSETSQNE